MTLAVQVITIIFMLTIIFIAIWGFVIANKAYNQFKYQNYLLEKISQNIFMIKSTDIINEYVNTSLKTEDTNLNYESDLKEVALEELDNVKFLNNKIGEQ